MMTPRQVRRSAIAAGIVLAAAPTAWLLARKAPGAAESSLVATVKRGDFHVTVTTSGELRAQKFVQITGPANAQQAQIYQMKIASIVPEGTTVKEGDVVAELDRSSAAT
jgi:multidrug efflux pump subunit AcrA (membrane-fusion protein)